MEESETKAVIRIGVGSCIIQIEGERADISTIIPIATTERELFSSVPC